VVPNLWKGRNAHDYKDHDGKLTEKSCEQVFTVVREFVDQAKKKSGS